MFPNAAAANQSIFYDRAGSARSVSQVYSVLNTRYAAAANSPVTRTAMAAAGGDLPRRVTVASATPAPTAIDNAAYLSSFPDQRSVTPVAAQRRRRPHRQQSEPIFRSLFQAGERTQPISPAVQELWGSNSSLTSVAPAPVAPHCRGHTARGSRTRPARSLQRPQRHVQQLTCAGVAWPRLMVCRDVSNHAARRSVRGHPSRRRAIRSRMRAVPVPGYLAPLTKRQ